MAGEAVSGLDPREPCADGEVGPAGRIPDEEVVKAMRLVTRGERFTLAAVRFPGMPLFPGHPAFAITSYRTPKGIRVAGDQPWGPPNDAQLGYMSEVVSGSVHSGAHIDALAHITVGEEARWHGGGNEAEHLGDFGPTFGDAAKLPPIIGRGVLLDVPAWKGVASLERGEAVDDRTLAAVAGSQGVTVGRWDTVLIRTGYMAWWPDREAMDRHRTPGPDLSAARWLADRGVVATGTDTETYEVQPAPDRGDPANPQPVHTYLLIEQGIYLLECLDLEALSRSQVYEFLFIALPLKIRGATGSMLDPVAIA